MFRIIPDPSAFSFRQLLFQHTEGLLRGPWCLLVCWYSEITIRVISCPDPQWLLPASASHWGTFKFYQALSHPSPSSHSLSLSGSLQAAFESGVGAMSCPPFKSQCLVYNRLLAHTWFLSMWIESKVIIINSGTLPNNWVVQKSLALKELEIYTFGGKTLSYTFFHNSIGERAWSFPMSLSGTGGDPRIGSCTPNDCTD